MVVVRLTTMVADFKTLANEKFIIGGTTFQQKNIHKIVTHRIILTVACTNKKEVERNTVGSSSIKSD